MVRTVELRSDTFTLPTESMRAAMAAAEVGDDVWDEDPTIHRLQERAAEMVGKEASLFVPSGTMGNLCALLSHTQPGQEVILELDSHIFQNEAGFPVHLDGARVFNAAVAQRIDVRQLTAPVDSVMFCLSKGLSAPVGSMLAGSSDFIERARRMRKMLGGGMRQAGVVAAAGLCALNEMVERLAEDHGNARRLAQGLSGLPGVDIDLSRVETNMVFGDCRPPLTAKAFIDRCREVGVLLDQASPYRWRMVTHRGVSVEDVDYAVEAIRRAFGAPALRATG